MESASIKTCSYLGISVLYGLTVCLAICVGTVSGSHAEDVRVGGSIGTSLQLRLQGCSSASSCEFLNLRNANTVGLTIDAAPSRDTELKADVVLRNINFHQVETLDDTGNISKVQPLDLRINEARLSLYNLFGLKRLDLAVGAMRIAWGTADGVNPLDRINPLNMEDGTGFGERLASTSIQLSWSWRQIRFEAVAVPLFMPAILPIDNIDFTALGDPTSVFELDQGVGKEPPSVHRIEAPIDAPPATVDNMQVGARFVWQSDIGDFSAVFYRGFESLPQASGQARLTGFQTANRVDLGVPLAYPRIMMAGADFRAPLVDRLSGWVEVAVLFPERHAISTARNQLESLVKLGHLAQVPDPLPEQVTQSDATYVQAVTGLDYTFPGDLYLNVQYARGMPTERQKADLHNYILMALRLPLLDGRLGLEAQGGLELGEGALGYSAGGAISWLHGDAARLTLSTRFLDGEPGTTFGRFEALSHVKLAFGMDF